MQGGPPHRLRVPEQGVPGYLPAGVRAPPPQQGTLYTSRPMQKCRPKIWFGFLPREIIYGLLTSRCLDPVRRKTREIKNDTSFLMRNCN